MKTQMTKTLISFLFISFLCTGLIAQHSLEGKWNGTISIPGLELEVTFEFTEAEDGWAGKLDIPMQNAKGLAITDIELSHDTVSFNIPDVPGNASLTANFDESGDQLKGMFTQMGQQFPTTLKRESAEDAQAAKEKLANNLLKFRHLADSLREKRNIAGFGAAIVYKGEVVLTDGFGFRDVEQNIKVDENTLFAIGSSTKAFTAMTLAMLVSEGKLEWEEPIRKYLPDFEMVDPFATQEMNAIDILCHRSGLPRHDLSWYGADASREELYQRIKYLEPNKSFRAAWQYQNFMFMLAGYLAEKLDGRTWEQQVQEKIFNPLGMNSSNLSISELKNNPNSSLGYRYDKEKEEFVLMPYKDIVNIGPAGSINSSARDMSKWLLLQLNKGKFDDQQIVAASDIEFMHQGHMQMPSRGSKEIFGQSYGLGWMTYGYRGKRVVEHGGNIDGFSALVYLLPDEDLGMVILTNENGTPFNNVLCRYITDIFLDLEEMDWDQKIYGEDKEEEEEDKEDTDETEKEEPVANTTPSHELSAFIGTYNNPGYGTVEVFETENGLRLKYNEFDLPMEHWHYNVFETKIDELESSFKWNFQSDLAGEVTTVSSILEPSTSDIVFHKSAPKKLSDPEFMAKLTGKYDLKFAVTTIELSGKNELKVTIPGQPAYTLTPWRNTEYKFKEINGISVAFVLDEAGKVTGIVVNQMGTKMNGERVE